MIKVYNYHPDNCIICNSISNGEPLCKRCQNASENFAIQISQNTKYKNWDNLIELFIKTHDKIYKKYSYGEENYKLCNELIGIGIFSIKHFPDKPDLLNEAYKSLDIEYKCDNINFDD